jgi:RES domain-containing protein
VLVYVPERPPALPATATPALTSKVPAAKPPPGIAPTAAQQTNAAVAAMSPIERIIAALQRSARFMGPELAAAFAQVFTLRNLEIFAALMLASAAANTNPVTGAVFDSAMLLFVYYQAGSAGVHALGLLLSTTIGAIRAGTEAQLDDAAKNYAHDFVGLGGAIFMAWLARRMLTEKGGGEVEPRRGDSQSSSEPIEPAGRPAQKPLRTKGVNLDARPAGKPFDATGYRLEAPRYVDTSFDIHPGNIAKNHRYSGEGVGSTYASTTPETALAEMDHYNSVVGRVPVTKQISLNNVLDLTDPSTRQQLNVTLDQITSDDYTITQQLGAFARSNGYDGILAPSAREIGGSNIVIFPKGP